MRDWTTLPEMLAAQAARYQDRPALWAKRAGAYRSISWKELRSQVEEAALGLLDLGLDPGDRAAILSENRPEWAIADLAILSAGGATVPIYTSLTSSEIEYILRHSGSRILFVSSTELMGKVLAFQETLGLKLILMDAPFRVSGPRVWWFGELLGLGRTSASQRRQELARRAEGLRPEDLASIIYTSGTTGPPKGVMLTHANFLSNCRAVGQILPLGESDRTLSFLPLSHVFERMAGYYFVLSVGGQIAYAENLDSVPRNLLEVHPTIITGVPRFYEKMHERIQEVIRSAPALRRRIFAWALRVGQERAQCELSGGPIPRNLALQHRIADRLVFSKLRAGLGGQLRFGVSGGAPLPKWIGEFFHAAGILILEGYGLTETSPVISVNRPDRFRFGTVGLPVPGVEVRLADDGEILTRGPHVMRGYFENPAATAEAIDPEGWFHTGDVGMLSPEGFLAITDRKKDLLKTSGGKMIAPQNLEAMLKSDPWVADAVVVGDRRKFVTALVVPNFEKLGAYARRHSISSASPADLVGKPEIVSAFWDRLRRVNEKLASFEQIKKVTLLAEPFTIAGGTLTPTLKVKRRVIAERYAAEIEAMYQE